MQRESQPKLSLTVAEASTDSVGQVGELGAESVSRSRNLCRFAVAWRANCDSRADTNIKVIDWVSVDVADYCRRSGLLPRVGQVLAIPAFTRAGCVVNHVKGGRRQGTTRIALNLESARKDIYQLEQISQYTAQSNIIITTD